MPSTMSKATTTKGASKASTVMREEIPMAESVGSYVSASCRIVPGALVPLAKFRACVRDHARSKLERKFRWRRNFDGLPHNIKVTRRTICKTCSAIRPTAETCGDHYDAIKGVHKASFVCGVVLPDDANPLIIDNEDSASDTPEAEATVAV